MKPETLRALLADKELGELTAEASELLDAYLIAVPAARADADTVARTIRTARETVRRFPELVAKPTSPVGSPVEVVRHWLAPSLAYAAALIAVAGIAAWLGFLAGASSHKANRMLTVTSNVPGASFQGLWAQYRVVYHSGRASVALARQP